MNLLEVLLLVSSVGDDIQLSAKKCNQWLHRHFALVEWYTVMIDKLIVGVFPTDLHPIIVLFPDIAQYHDPVVGLQ